MDLESLFITAATKCLTTFIGGACRATSGIFRGMIYAGSSVVQFTSNQFSKKDQIHLRINELINGKIPITFFGFSGQGYENKPKVRKAIESILEEATEKYGKNNYVVVGGATSDGIGMVYELAIERDISVIGIVSEQAQKSHCETVTKTEETIYTPDPNGTWKTVDVNGNSYMVYAASQGVSVFFGGGGVAASEAEEHINNGCAGKVIVVDAKPDPSKSNGEESPVVTLAHEKQLPVYSLDNQEEILNRITQIFQEKTLKNIAYVKSVRGV